MVTSLDEPQSAAKRFSSFDISRRRAIGVSVFLACAAASPSSGQENLLAQSPSMTAFEEYWTALADLDLVALRRAAQNELGIAFSNGVALLAAGNHQRAESSFVAMSRQHSDANIAVASEILLAITLLGEQEWGKLRDVIANSQLSPADRKHTEELGRWGKAFASVDRPVTILPQSPVTLELNLSPLGTPTIQVLINGREYRFWLDTGSTLTVLSSDVAARAGVGLIGSDALTVGTFAGVANARPAVLKRLEIGPIALLNVPAIVIDADLMRVNVQGDGIPSSGLKIDGIIGWDTIRQFNISIDYKHGTIAIQAPERLGTIGTPSQNLTWFGKPIIEVRTKSGQTLHFALDTGAQVTLLNASVLDKVRIRPQTSTARLVGIAQTEGRMVRGIPALELEVAGKSVKLKDLLVSNRVAWNLVNCDGVLGSDISHSGTIRIDATNGLFSVGL
jgi:clan AA aspartic protease (TIGR02281 family)